MQNLPFQIYCHYYIILCNILKQPAIFATRDHFTKWYKYPQNLGDHHPLVKKLHGTKDCKTLGPFIPPQYNQTLLS